MARALRAEEGLRVDGRQDAVREMVAQVPADPRERQQCVDPVALERLRRADPREHQQPGRVDGARGEHHLTRGVGLLLVAVQEVADAPRAPALHEQADGVGGRQDGEVRSAHRRAQVRVDHAEAPAAENRDRCQRDALVVGGVEVAGPRDARRDGGLDEVERQRAR